MRPNATVLRLTGATILSICLASGTVALPSVSRGGSIADDTWPLNQAVSPFYGIKRFVVHVILSRDQSYAWGHTNQELEAAIFNDVKLIARDFEAPIIGQWSQADANRGYPEDVGVIDLHVSVSPLMSGSQNLGLVQMECMTLMRTARIKGEQPIGMNANTVTNYRLWVGSGQGFTETSQANKASLYSDFFSDWKGQRDYVASRQ